MSFDLTTVCCKRVAILLSAGLCSSLFAQSAYDDAIESAKPPRELQTSPKELVIEQSNEALVLDDSEKLFIKGFVVEGALEGDSFEEILTPYKNRELSMRDINEAALKVAKYYIDQGYLTAVAFTPKQSVKNDTLTIQVVIGKYGKVSYDNTSPVTNFVVKTSLEKSLKSGAYVTSASLERAMLLIDDMAGAGLPTVIILEGKEFGSSDFDFSVGSENRFGGYITGDNYGSRLTGKYRVSAGVDINSPLKLGDKLSFSGLKGKDLQNGRAAYAFPLYSNGLKGEISIEKTDYELGQEYRDLEAVGDARTLSAGLSYPIIRTQYENLYVSAGFAQRDMEDRIKVLDITIPKEINVASLGISYEAYTTIFGLNAFVVADGTFNAGRLKIEDEVQNELNKNGANTVGDYQKFDISLLSSVALSESFTLNTNVRAQKALKSKNLDASEQISITGIGGVRGFPDAEYSADSGFAAGAELNYKLPQFIGISHNIGVFFDVGRGFVEDRDYGAAPKSRTLGDVGLSYYVKYKSFFAKAQAANIVGKENVLSQEDYNTRYLLQTGATF
ncbi:MAG: ShlB/FhaC/HecB family hemolysin secretion/activation protein [Campylobacteraceae bacterium]|jgi:hemolysin activation/secretion protein|nr:ShlB/FhaC/HecB family hemolysin secretion/activation protein [Campylobacteraceae bacterium]